MRDKVILICIVVGFLIGLINLYFLETRFTLVYPIALALKYLTNCQGPCWGLIVYAMILTLLIWVLVGLFAGFMLKRMLSTKKQ